MTERNSEEFVLSEKILIRIRNIDYSAEARINMRKIQVINLSLFNL